MVIAESRNDTEVSLAEFLRNRARHSSDARLAVDAISGFVVAVTAILWRGPGWYVLASGALCFFAYGVWGIGDRELHERQATAGHQTLPLRVVRVVAVIVGIAAASMFALGSLAALLGTIIS